MRAHRTVVFCDDYGQRWGWWCLDCDSWRDAGVPKPTAERQAYRHREAPHIERKAA